MEWFYFLDTPFGHDEAVKQTETKEKDMEDRPSTSLGNTAASGKTATSKRI